MSFLLRRLDEFENLVKKTEFSKKQKPLIFEQAQEQIHGVYAEALKLNRKIFVIGNGGSSGIASHHVIDLVNVVKAPAFSLCDSNIITCLGNDYGYEYVFSKALDAQAGEKDILIAISSSGQSKNILQACDTIRKKNGLIITLSGFKKDNPLRLVGDVNIWTGASDYGLVETAHFFILHTFIDAWAIKQTQPLINTQTLI